MRKIEEGGYPRYMVSVIKCGKVTGSAWAETRVGAKRMCDELEKEDGVETEVRDMTYLDEWSGYKAFEEARERWKGKKGAVWCVQERRAFRSDVSAENVTGDTRYYIKRSYLMGEKTPSGRNWRKINY